MSNFCIKLGTVGCVFTSTRTLNQHRDNLARGSPLNLLNFPLSQMLKILLAGTFFGLSLSKLIGFQFFWTLGRKFLSWFSAKILALTWSTIKRKIYINTFHMAWCNIWEEYPKISQKINHNKFGIFSTKCQQEGDVLFWVQSWQLVDGLAWNLVQTVMFPGGGVALQLVVHYM